MPFMILGEDARFWDAQDWTENEKQALRFEATAYEDPWLACDQAKPQPAEQSGTKCFLIATAT